MMNFWTKQKIHILVCLAFVVLSFVLYSNTLHGEFIGDDNVFVNTPTIQNPASVFTNWVTPTVAPLGLYRPITETTFSLNFLLFGNSTLSFHVVNVILNGIVAFLLYLLIIYLFNNPNLALISSVLFIVLPIHTEAVSFIKARDELMSAMFILLSWIYFLRAESEQTILKKKTLHRLLSAIFYFCAVLSKEFAIIAPALFFAVDFIKNQNMKVNLKENFRKFLPFLITLPIYLSIDFLVVGKGILGISGMSSFVIDPLLYTPFIPRIFTAFKIGFIYMSKTFYPLHLSATYHYDSLPIINNLFSSPEAIIGLLLIISTVFLIFYKKTRSSPIGIGALIFFISYLPFSKLIFAGGDMAGERWMYLPSMGLCMIAGFLLLEIYKRWKFPAIAFFILLFCFYSIYTVKRNNIWKTSRAFAENMVADAPNSVQALGALAAERLDEGNLPEADAYITKARSIYENTYTVLDISGNVALAEGKYEDAENYFGQAIEQSPADFELYHNYLLALAKEGKFSLLLEKATALHEQYPEDQKTLTYIALALYKLGRLDEATSYVDMLPLPHDKIWNDMKNFSSEPAPVQ